MFDLGFSEIVVIGVVALVVVGPERLPKVARTVGHLLGRAQRYVTDVKADISREMQLEELQKLQQQVTEQARELESSVRAGVSSIESGVNAAQAELRNELGEVLPDSASAATGVADEAPPGAASAISTSLPDESDLVPVSPPVQVSDVPAAAAPVSASATEEGQRS